MALTLSSIGIAQTKSTLFLGNSYTGSNNLPLLIYNLALSNGDTLIYDSNTPGGYTLDGHSTNSTSINKINSQNWDYVVLQEQSQIPSFPQGQVASICYPFASQLDSIITTNDSCTETVFFMTWGRENGDASNCAAWPPVCTYAGMQWQLRLSYLNMANTNTAICSPVGSAWQLTRLTDPTISLYTGDGSHPNINGSYLAACVFYATLWRKSPVGLSFYSTVDTTTAQFLQQMAHAAVFDSLDTWNIGTYDVLAGFEYQLDTGLSVVFTDTSSNETSLWWDFGTGDNAATDTVHYTFPAAGTYQVTLLASNGCMTDTVQMQITVTGPVGIDQPDKTTLLLYPNPANDKIRLDLGDNTRPELVEVFSTAGHLIRRHENPGLELDVSDLAPGTYLLRVNGTGSARFMIR